MKSALRVLQVFASLDSGGAESRMMDIYRSLDKKIISFDFVTLQQSNQFFENEIQELGGTIYRLNSPRDIGIKKHIDELRDCMRKGKYDAVHAHTSYHCGVVMLAAWLERIPVRITHARTAGSINQKKAFNPAISIGKLLVKIFSTQRFAISMTAGEYLFGRSSFEVVPNTIVVEKYLETSVDKTDAFRTELHIDKESFVIGQIGRFDPMKNQSFTVEWFNDYLTKNTSAVLVFVGTGPLRAEIEKKCNKLGIMDKIVFTGVRNDVNEFIHIFDVLFFPSLFEGLGGVALEAQAAGVPVVESDVIPPESDVKIGMVERCSLNEQFDNWSKAVEISRRKKIPSNAERLKAFESMGYSIDAVTKKYVNAYKGK